MFNVNQRCKTVVMVGFMLFSLALCGCAVNGEVKGGGTIIGNPCVPSLPATPEDPHKQTYPVLTAEREWNE